MVREGHIPLSKEEADTRVPSLKNMRRVFKSLSNYYCIFTCQDSSHDYQLSLNQTMLVYSLLLRCPSMELCLKNMEEL